MVKRGTKSERNVGYPLKARSVSLRPYRIITFSTELGKKKNLHNLCSISFKITVILEGASLKNLIFIFEFNFKILIFQSVNNK